jgi:5'-methylthioadenosine phosphorylase
MDLSPDLALIAGTGIEAWPFEQARSYVLPTPYGDVGLQVARFAGEDLVVIARHGPGHSLPPHRVNSRGMIWALKSLGVTKVVASSAVGAVDPALHPGDLRVIDDLIDFTRQRPLTFFDAPGQVRHVDMTAAYCPMLSRLLKKAIGQPAAAAPLVYAAMEGPRFETPAEIRALAQLGAHVVGMTQAPEVTLAREAGLCYSAVAVVTNPAAGLAKEPIEESAIYAVLAKALDRFQQSFAAFLGELSRVAACQSCPDAEAGLFPLLNLDGTIQKGV